MYGFPFLHILCYQRWFSRIPIEPCDRSIKNWSVVTWPLSSRGVLKGHVGVRFITCVYAYICKHCSTTIVLTFYSHSSAKKQWPQTKGIRLGRERCLLVSIWANKMYTNASDNLLWPKSNVYQPLLSIWAILFVLTIWPWVDQSLWPHNFIAFLGGFTWGHEKKTSAIY